MTKYVVLISLLLILFFSGLANATLPSADSLSLRLNRSLQDQWFGQDKAHHFMTSAFITGFTYYAVKQELNQSQKTANAAAVSLSFSIGLAKEIYDGVSHKGTPSFKDLMADMAGIAVGFLILNVSSL